MTLQAKIARRKIGRRILTDTYLMSKKCLCLSFLLFLLMYLVFFLLFSSILLFLSLIFTFSPSFFCQSPLRPPVRVVTIPWPREIAPPYCHFSPMVKGRRRHSCPGLSDTVLGSRTSPVVWQREGRGSFLPY